MSSEGRADSTLPQPAEVASTSQALTALKPGAPATAATGAATAVAPALGPPKETLESILLALDTEK